MSPSRAGHDAITARLRPSRLAAIFCCLALLQGLLATDRGLAEEARNLAAQTGPVPYRHGRLNLRDDPQGRLATALIELVRRRNGRRMVDRLIDSGFVTVLVSTRLRPMQAGLWGPIFYRGRAIGATLYVDLIQIHHVDHDPTGVETLAHELRHQIDASRAFRHRGEYSAIHKAALSGDRTGSAQQYARRVRQQRPDLTASEALAWLEPRLHRVDPPAAQLIASIPGRNADD